jgi:hypothetical protein
MDLRLRNIKIELIPAYKTKEIYIRKEYTVQMHKLKKLLRQMVRRLILEHENLSFLDDICYHQAIYKALGFCKILTSRLSSLFIYRQLVSRISYNEWRSILYKLFNLGEYIIQFYDNVKALVNTKDSHFYHKELQNRDMHRAVDGRILSSDMLQQFAYDAENLQDNL